MTQVQYATVNLREQGRVVGADDEFTRPAARTIPGRYRRRPDLFTRADAPQDITSLPTEVNLHLYQGDDFWLVITVETAAGAPYPLAGVVAKSQIRSGIADESPVMAEFAPTVASSLAASTVTLHLTSPQATLLVPGSNRWDCQITLSNGWVTTLCAGACVVTGEVTR